MKAQGLDHIGVISFGFLLRVDDFADDIDGHDGDALLFAKHGQCGEGDAEEQRPLLALFDGLEMGEKAQKEEER